MKRLLLIFMLCVFLFSFTAFAETIPTVEHTIFSTNLAYISLSALSLSEGGKLIIVPIENQTYFSKHFSINSAITSLYFGTTASSTSGMMILGECGIGYHIQADGLTGWCFSLMPGLVLTFDTMKLAFSLSGEAGYQWVFNDGIFLGLGVGGKSIWMDGNLLIPDLKLRIGYAF